MIPTFSKECAVRFLRRKDSYHHGETVLHVFSERRSELRSYRQLCAKISSTVDVHFILWFKFTNYPILIFVSSLSQEVLRGGLFLTCFLLLYSPKLLQSL